MKVFIDLFCGLGGASEAFVHDREWKVIRIDNNPELLDHVRGMWLLDMSDWAEVLMVIRAHIDVDDQLFVWASPPCTDFSTKNPDRDAENFDMTLLDNTLHLIDYLQRNYSVTGWIVENVRGAIEPFTEHMNREYSQRIGPFFLWGSFIPIALVDASLDRHRKPFNKTNSRTPLRSNIHALVPYALSDSLRLTINNQKSILGYLTDTESC